MPDRTEVPVPTIKSLDFAFSSAGEDPELRQAIRLHNIRGVVSHAVVVGSSTSEIELTAYIATPKTAPSAAMEPSSSKDAIASGSAGASAAAVPPAIEGARGVTKVNGNPGTLPKFVYPKARREKPHGMRGPSLLPAGRLETKIEVVSTKPAAWLRRAPSLSAASCSSMFRVSRTTRELCASCET